MLTEIVQNMHPPRGNPYDLLSVAFTTALNTLDAFHDAYSDGHLSTAVSQGIHLQSST